MIKFGSGKQVSTHSHPKVAALVIRHLFHLFDVSTHSHPKVAATITLKHE